MIKEVIQIEVNGKKLNVPIETTIKDITEMLNMGGANIIAELNGNIIVNRDFEITMVMEGAKIELIRFVGGG